MACNLSRSFLLILYASMSLAQTGTVHHIEQNDPSIVYTGTWYTNNSPSNSGGLAALTNAKGAQAVLTFTGTGITWIGVSDPYSGLAWVYLDGTPSTIDTYSSATLYQQPLFTVSGLTPGVHTFSIEVPHERDGSTSGSWVWIDGFDIPNGSGVTGGAVAGAGLAQENNPALIYTGQWFSKSGVSYSGGGAVLATDPGSGVSITFNGSGITWIGYRDQWSGIAQVYLDGSLTATVDTYLSPAQYQAPVYSVAGLAPGTHSLSIQATGTHSSSSQDSWVWLDAFNVVEGSGPPALAAAGVVSAASYSPAPNNLVTQGQIISIFGSNFLMSGRADATGLPLPTQLGPGNTSVNVCGQNIPLYNLLPGQINGQLPFECPGSGAMPLIVTSGGQASTAQTINLVAASPGIFTVNSSGVGDGVILHADNTLVSAASPASGGEQVVIYCTGLGPTTPSFPTGAAVTASNVTMSPVTVTVGGKNATVAHSGLTVGFAGLYQVNVIIPPGLSGGQPVVMNAGGIVSPAGVTVSVMQ
jgi:uncharacterized protein (TIGR03437 family)